MKEQSKANQVPLVELLAAVPADIRVGVDDGNDWKAGTTWHPVGLLCHEAATELRRLYAVNAQLLDALEATTAMLDQSDCLTGYCCCGSAIDGHGFGDGHTPVDEGAYHQAAALGQARAAIAEAKEQA
jgi:hypothetical protein